MEFVKRTSKSHLNIIDTNTLIDLLIKKLIIEKIIEKKINNFIMENTTEQLLNQIKPESDGLQYYLHDFWVKYEDPRMAKRKVF